MAVSPVAAGCDYPQMIARTDHAEPAPRRVRATLGGEQIFDTTRAWYVWEWPYYPQYYIPPYSDHTRITGHRRNPDGDEVPESATAISRGREALPRSINYRGDGPISAESRC